MTLPRKIFLGLVGLLLMQSAGDGESPLQAAGIAFAVRVAPVSLDVSQSGSIQISWNQPAGTSEVLICNLDGIVVKTLMDNLPQAVGSHAVSWNGTDDLGRLCPPGAYVPILRVRQPNGAYEVYNPTEAPWGYRLTATAVNYDAERQIVSFTLDQPALCLLRIGVKEGGPVYVSLLDWRPLPAGVHEISWDGMDVDDLLRVAGKENLEFVLDAYRVPVDSILLTGSENREQRFDDLDKNFPLYPPHGSDLFLHALHKRRTCGDMRIRIALEATQADPKTMPTIYGKTVLRVLPAEGVDLELLRREKFELYLFVDGRFLYEGPKETLPASLELDTAAFSDGEHVITVNLRTPEDHVGIGSAKVRIKNGAD